MSLNYIQTDDKIYISEDSLKKMILLVKEISANLESYQRMCRTVLTNSEESRYGLDNGQLIVNQDDFAKLSTEVAQLTQNLPKVFTKKLITTLNQMENISKEIEVAKKAVDETTLERNHWKVRCDVATQDCQNEKERNLQLSRQVQELTDEMSRQSDYCSSLGSACCTLLWRVSRCEESIQAILIGSKVDEFLLLVQSTLDSFLTTYKEDWPQEKTNEEHFILALCGIITNIAASAYGRDFLVTNPCGCKVIDTFLTILNEAPSKKSTKLKNLILMSLYNLSINQKGMKYISNKPNFFQLLVWLLKEEPSNECCINILRLLQSVISEANITVLHQLKELLPDKDLHLLTTSRNKDIRDLASELCIDLNY